MTSDELEAKKFRYAAKLHLAQAFEFYRQAQAIDPENTQQRIEEAVSAISKLVPALKTTLLAREAAHAQDKTELAAVKSAHLQAMVELQALKQSAAEDAPEIEWLEKFIAANPAEATPPTTPVKS